MLQSDASIFPVYASTICAVAVCGMNLLPGFLGAALCVAEKFWQDRLAVPYTKSGDRRSVGYQQTFYACNGSSSVFPRAVLGGVCRFEGLNHSQY